MRKSLKTCAPHCSTSVERVRLLLPEPAGQKTTTPRKSCGRATESGICQTCSKGLDYASAHPREVKNIGLIFTENVSLTLKK